MLFHFLGGNLVTQRSKKWNIVTTSTVESKFGAIAQGICDLLWSKMILKDLRIKWDSPIRICDDNISAISIAHNLVQPKSTKHIKIDRHSINKKLENGLICTSCMPTNSQLVDVLTKDLNNQVFQTTIARLGMNNVYSPTWVGVLEVCVISV